MLLLVTWPRFKVTCAVAFCKMYLYMAHTNPQTRNPEWQSPLWCSTEKNSTFFFFNELSVWYTPPGGNEPSELKLAHPLNLKDYFWWLRLRLRLFVF